MATVTRAGDGRVTFVEAGRGPTAETDERAMGPAMVPEEEMAAAPGFAGRCARTSLPLAASLVLFYCMEGRVEGRVRSEVTVLGASGLGLATSSTEFLGRLRRGSFVILPPSFLLIRRIAV